MWLVLTPVALFLLLAVLMLLSFCVSCGGNANPETPEEETRPVAVIDIVADGVTEYKVMRSENAGKDRQAEIDAAVAFVKEQGKEYHDLSARKLVDAAIAATIAALFIRLAAKGADPEWAEQKTLALEYWLATRFPQARCELEKAKSGLLVAVTEFAKLAPAVTLAD